MPYLFYGSEPGMRLDCQILLKSLPLDLLGGSAPVSSHPSSEILVSCIVHSVTNRGHPLTSRVNCNCVGSANLPTVASSDTSVVPHFSGQPLPPSVYGFASANIGWNHSHYELAFHST